LPSTATVPTPLSIDTLSAPVVVQAKVAEPTAVIALGAAAKPSTLGAAAFCTSTVTGAETRALPAASDARAAI
jgi:hypothetical protein